MGFAMKSLIQLSVLGLFLSFVVSIVEVKEDVVQQKTIKDMKLKITFSDVELIATIYDNPTSRDFVSRLPITTQLEDYASNEKIFYPEEKLTKEGAPSGYEPKTGDITYYAPWGDVAIFYKDFSYSTGLISLGKIEGDGIKKLKNVGDEKVTFELLK